MAKKDKKYKRCPRCDTKALINQPKCEMCGLVYARMNYATNAEAKRALKKHQKHLVVYDKTLPKDVNKWKLFCMAFFLGLFGGHRFYVGRYKGAYYSIIAIMMLFISVCFPQTWWSVWYLALVIWVFIFPAGPNVVMWAWDWVAILSNKYKVPVAIEEANLVLSKAIEDKEVLKIVKDLDKQVKEQTKEQVKETENKEEKILEDELNPTIVKENVNKGNLGKKVQPKKVQKAKKEPEPQEDDHFVPKSKVISSEEVKRLINKNQRKTNNNQNKKKK